MKKRLNMLTPLSILTVFACITVLNIPFVLSSETPEGITEAYQIISEALSHYENEEYKAANESLIQLIDPPPHWRVMLELRKRIDIGTFSGIITDTILRERPDEKKELAETASTLLQLMSEAQRRKMVDVKDIEKVIKNFKTGEHKQYLEARATLIAHDRYSVPYLLDLLAKTGEDQQRLLARTTTTLRDIGRSATPPLTAALQTEDEVLRSRVIAALEKLAGRTAFPPLLKIAEDPNESPHNREAAWKAIAAIQERMRKPVELDTATDAYVKLAELYLHEQTAHVGHVLGGYSDIWGWDATRDSVKNQLTLQFVPSYIHHQVQGARVVLKGLESAPGHLQLQGLMIALMSRELAHLQRYAQKGHETQQAEFAARRMEKVLVPFTRISHLFGPEAAGLALKRTLDTDDPEAALRIIDLLFREAQPAEAVGDALCRSMDYEHPKVRIKSALTALKTSPEGRICSPETTIRIIKTALEYEDIRTIYGAPEEDLLKTLLTVITEKSHRMENYPLTDLEPAFTTAMEKHPEDKALQKLLLQTFIDFGTPGAIPTLNGVISDKDIPESMRAAACNAVAAITRRYPDIEHDSGLKSTLLQALQSPSADLQHQAANALRAMELSPVDILEITNSEIEKTQMITPGDMLDIEPEFNVDDEPSVF